MSKFIKLHEGKTEHLLKFSSIIHVWDSQYNDEDCRTVHYFDGRVSKSITVTETISQIESKLFNAK